MPENYIIKEFPEDHLRKTFDELGRIVKIDFLLSGKSCEIKYSEDKYNMVNIRHIDWSNGYRYLTCDNLNEDQEIKSHTVLESSNPKGEYAINMEFDLNNKPILLERVSYNGEILAMSDIFSIIGSHNNERSVV